MKVKTFVQESDAFPQNGRKYLQMTYRIRFKHPEYINNYYLLYIEYIKVTITRQAGPSRLARVQGFSRPQKPRIVAVSSPWQK